MLDNASLLLRYGAILLLILAVILVLLAAIRNKNVFVKLLVLEVLANLFICGVGIFSLNVSFSPLLDICIALSLITFLSTAAYCQYIVNRGKKNA